MASYYIQFKEEKPSNDNSARAKCIARVIGKQAIEKWLELYQIIFQTSRIVYHVRTSTEYDDLSIIINDR